MNKTVTDNRCAGKFIAFEGIDGSGKSTQINRLIKKLTEMNVACCGTKEPTDAPVGALIRQLLTGRMTADNKVIASLFIADRTDHLLNETDGIMQKINSGITVITDRYYFSSYAYHGVDVDMDWVIDGNKINSDILRPSVTVFLDVPVKKALERIEKNRFHKELFEKEERLTKVREKYFEAFDKLKDMENVAVIDADADEETVFGRIWEAVSAYI